MLDDELRWLVVLVAVVAAAVVAVDQARQRTALWLLDEMDREEEEAAGGERREQKANAGLGTGRVPRSIYHLHTPIDCYGDRHDSHPVQFQRRFRFTPAEFDALLAEVRHDIERPRNTRYVFSELQQRNRRRQSTKISTANRLAMTLTMLRSQYVVDGC